MAAKQLKKKRGRPSSTPPTTPRKFKFCHNCFAKIYPGCSHSNAQCHSKKHKLKNITDNILEDEKTKQQIGSQILKDAKRDGDKTVQLATLGTPLSVSVGAPKQSSQSQLTANELISMQVNAGLSDRQLFCILRDLHLKFGRKCVESKVHAMLVERKTIFADLFTQEITQFQDNDQNSLERPFVYCHDTQEFIDRICLLRGNSAFCTEDKLGFDEGKGFLKLTLSVYDPDDTIPNDATESKRITRSQGIKGGTNCVDTGVNKVFILAAAPKTPENYENCKLFIDKTVVNDTVFHFSADLKLTNICLGIMSHSSRHPCPYCEGTKNVFEKDAPTRTLESISENYCKWREESGRKDKLKDYNNCSHEPLFTSLHGATTLVLDIVPPPALHIKLGVVNRLFDELLKLFQGVTDWPKQLCIVREDYHGKSYEGNECNKLLKNLDKLSEILPTSLSQFYDCFVAFRDAMGACMGFTLDPMYREKVASFEKSYQNLNIPITSKVHIMIRHVPEFIERHKKPLGQFSEQVVESCHSKFDKLFKSYCIKDIHHDNYLAQLYKSVMHFNSYHI